MRHAEGADGRPGRNACVSTAHRVANAEKNATHATSVVLPVESGGEIFDRLDCGVRGGVAGGVFCGAETFDCGGEEALLEIGGVGATLD